MPRERESAMTEELINERLAREILGRYSRAKDDNKPHLLTEVFSPGAVLEMEVATENISFPASTAGLDEITGVLVRDFSRNWENVYTFCFEDSLSYRERGLSCGWLVAMNDRNDGSVRVGRGRYDWAFCDENGLLSDHLVISIEQMVALPPGCSGQILGWVSSLPYPWCDSALAFTAMPALDSLSPLRPAV